jgi:hypothetical protein
MDPDPELGGPKTCGSGSGTLVFELPGSGSISQMYGSGSFYHQAKKVRKNLDSYFFVTSF